MRGVADKPTSPHRAGTWRSDTGQIRGVDGEWYNVPHPVLQRYLLGLGLSSVAKHSLPAIVRERIPELMREAAEGPREMEADPDIWPLMVTDKLLETVTAYFESGSIEDLLDVLEAVFAVAELRGYDRSEVLTQAALKREQLGGFGHRRLLRPSG